MTTFSVVATPIGNLEDITLRALEVLRKADVILCEDTRMTKRLLDRHNISVPTKSYHTHSKLSKIEEIISMIREGKNLSLVSDAGTPGISDPGIELVKYLRQVLNDELKEGSLKIETIPGPSALTASIAIAGIPCADFTFLGFLPHKKGRETLFKEIASSERTMIFYESPHRIMKTLDSLIQHCEAKKVTVCRELTKMFEEVVAGTAVEVKEFFERNKEKIKGEFVVLVS
jgi:16S rRNA (cytidine1402-2'-O)-methyltransferase